MMIIRRHSRKHLLVCMPALYSMCCCHSWIAYSGLVQAIQLPVKHHVSLPLGSKLLSRSPTLCTSHIRRIHNRRRSYSGKRVYAALGEESESMTPSSFEEWKEYFLRNNLGDPSKSPTSWEVSPVEELVSKGAFTSKRGGGSAAKLEANEYTLNSAIEITKDTGTTSDIDGSTSNTDVINIAPDETQTESFNSFSQGTTSESRIETNVILGETAYEMPTDGVAENRISAAAKIMSLRGESDPNSSLRAFKLLEEERIMNIENKASSASVSSYHLNKLSAEAELAWLRSSTEGNQLMFMSDGRSGTSDTPEFRRMWKDVTPKIFKLIAGVDVDPSQDPQLQQMLVETIMYSLSSKGIIQAFTSGETGAYTTAVHKLLKRHPTQDNGVAYIFHGAYFLAAPWPIRNPRKASLNFEKALEVNGRSRRNLFYAGLGRLECGDRDGAAEAFQRILSDELSEFASFTELDIGKALRREAQKGLAFATRNR